jgi:hypothetical protein
MEKLSKETQRRLGWRRRQTEFVPWLILAGLAVAYWQRERLMLPSGLSFYVLAAFVLLGFHRIESRLKAMQLRLAWMHDRLDAIAGLEPDDHFETELGAG